MDFANQEVVMRDKIKMIIDEWDPIGLLYGEAPDDEYDPEINEIFRLLPSIKGPEELASIIQKSLFSILMIIYLDGITLIA